MKNTPKTLTGDELFLLFDELRKHSASVASTRRALRNYTMALLMVDAGLRVGELVKLQRADLFVSNSPVNTLLIRGGIAKSGKDRTVPLSVRVRETLQQSFDLGKDDYQYAESMYFFRPNEFDVHLTTRQVERIIRTAAMKSLGRPVHPHVLRHTFATRLMQRTNVRVVQELLGHSSVVSTQIYTHPNEEDKKHAIQQLCLETDSSGSLTGQAKLPA